MPLPTSCKQDINIVNIKIPIVLNFTYTDILLTQGLPTSIHQPRTPHYCDFGFRNFNCM